MKEIRPYLVAFSAVVSFLAFPPFPLGPVIFISLVPLLLAIDGLAPYRAFKFGYLWGVIFYAGMVYYIAWVTIPGMIATVLILALIPATSMLIYSRLAAKLPSLAMLSIPVYFLTWNWLLTKSDLNYPWTDIGYSLSYFLPLIQAAEIGGVYLISLCIFVVNILVFKSISESPVKSWSGRSRSMIIAVIIILSLYSYGVVRIRDLRNDLPEDTLTVGMVQGNITKDIKWNRDGLQVSFDRYFSLSSRAVADGAELLVWPETAIPTYLAQEPGNMTMVTSFVDSIDTPLLTGVVYYTVDSLGEYVYFNSAMLLEPQKTGYQLYSKIHLVPMSEKIPFSGKVKKLKDIHLGQADFTSGVQMTVFNTDGLDFSTLICFESVFPGFTREFTRLGARMLVVITNDMWFGNTSLYEQHAMMAVFRAIENRVPVVRAANTGVSMAVDKSGCILAKSSTFTEEYLVATIHPETSKSLYNKSGDFIPMVSAPVALICLIIAFWRRKGYIHERYVE
jgi:apolipoprotein N-acyltransferase